MKADDLITKIDDELLRIDHTSRTKTEYKIFDFYTAIKALKESILADASSRQEYFRLKIGQYKSVFYDLFFTESKTIVIEYLDYNPETRALRQKETVTLCMSPYSRVESVSETIVDQERHERWVQIGIDVKGKNPLVISINKYDYLLDGCFPRMETAEHIANYIQKTNPIYALKSDFNSLFPSTVDWKSYNDIAFEGYIKQLKFERGINEKNMLESSEDDSSESKLTLAQIALKYIYKGEQITRSNAGEIAKRYGLTSGDALYQKFNCYYK